MKKVYAQIADKCLAVCSSLQAELGNAYQGNVQHICSNEAWSFALAKQTMELGEYDSGWNKSLLANAKAVKWYSERIRTDEKFRVKEMTLEGAYPDINQFTYSTEGIEQQRKIYGRQEQQLQYIQLVRQKMTSSKI